MPTTRRKTSSQPKASKHRVPADSLTTKLLDTSITNAMIAEWLAQAAEHAKMPLQKALRRASRKSFLWAEEAVLMVQNGESLTELPGVGPTLNRIIRGWLENPPETSEQRPEIRSGFLSLPQAQAALAKNPAWAARVKGDLQMHTVWSDGSDSIEDMARAAAERGYEYIAITDHSKGLKIAGGIDEQQLLNQEEEIRRVNDLLQTEGSQLRVLRSIELNINPQGEGDMEESALRRLDLVLGCFHSALRKKDDQTERYLAALKNPTIHILGHPRGRIYNFRLGLTADWSRVFAMAAKLDKAVEIDGYPDRQDLSFDLLRLAKKEGCRISLGTDSHGASQLRFMDFSLAAALLSGIEPDRILNFMSREELLQWASALRQ